MSKYLPTVPFQCEFDGDHLSMTLRAIERGDLLRGAVESLTDKSVYFTELFLKYADNFSGLIDATGAPITKEVVARDNYFFDIINAVVRELFRRARPENPTLPGSPVVAPSPGTASEATTASADSVAAPGPAFTGVARG